MRAFLAGVVALIVFMVRTRACAEEVYNTPVWTLPTITSYNIQCPSYSYFAKPDQTSLKTSWDPMVQPFPVDLNFQFRLAFETVTNLQEWRSVKEIQLQTIYIRRILLPNSDIVANNKSRKELTNQWIIVFTFGQNQSVCLRAVVMFFDNSHAVEKPCVGSLRAAMEPFNESPSWIQNAKEVGLIDEGIIAAKTHRAEFKIPRSQWDPSKGEFPLDLASESRRLVKELNRDKRKLILREIMIHRYLPFEAAIGAGIDVVEVNLNHWYVKFEYSEEDQPLLPRKNVFVTLDGTIL